MKIDNALRRENKIKKRSKRGLDNRNIFTLEDLINKDKRRKIKKKNE